MKNNKELEEKELEKVSGGKSFLRGGANLIAGSFFSTEVEGMKTAVCPVCGELCNDTDADKRSTIFYCEKCKKGFNE